MKESAVVAKNETITGTQIRAARGFLAWDRRDLAKKSVVTLYTIERLETGAEISGAAMTKGLAAIKTTLEAAGIEFTSNAGVLGVLLHQKKGK
jgi:transcriptional regulator with XRE-family HTH domain